VRNVEELGGNQVDQLHELVAKKYHWKAYWSAHQMERQRQMEAERTQRDFYSKPENAVC